VSLFDHAAGATTGVGRGDQEPGGVKRLVSRGQSFACDRDNEYARLIALSARNPTIAPTIFMLTSSAVTRHGVIYDGHVTILSQNTRAQCHCAHEQVAWMPENLTVL